MDDLKQAYKHKKIENEFNQHHSRLQLTIELEKQSKINNVIKILILFKMF